MQKRKTHEVQLFKKLKQYGIYEINETNLYIYSYDIVTKNGLHCKLDYQYPFKGCTFYIVQLSDLYLRMILNICNKFACREKSIAEYILKCIPNYGSMHCKQYLYEYEINKGNEKEAMDVMQNYDTKLEHSIVKKLHDYVVLLDNEFNIFLK